MIGKSQRLTGSYRKYVTSGSEVSISDRKWPKADDFRFENLNVRSKTRHELYLAEGIREPISVRKIVESIGRSTG